MTVTVMVRIRALETAARGAIRTPRGDDPPQEPDPKTGKRRLNLRPYRKALISATPKKPKLKVIAIKTGTGQTTIEVGILHPDDGMVISDFSTKGILTPENAAATGKDISEALGDRSRGGIEMCGRRLVELTREPEGTKVVFALGPGRQVAITSGEDA